MLSMRGYICCRTLHNCRFVTVCCPRITWSRQTCPIVSWCARSPYCLLSRSVPDKCWSDSVIERIWRSTTRRHSITSDHLSIEVLFIVYRITLEQTIKLLNRIIRSLNQRTSRLNFRLHTNHTQKKSKQCTEHNTKYHKWYKQLRQSKRFAWNTMMHELKKMNKNLLPPPYQTSRKMQVHVAIPSINLIYELIYLFVENHHGIDTYCHW